MTESTSNREQSLLNLVCLIGAGLFLALVAYNLLAAGAVISTDGLFFTVVPLLLAAILYYALIPLVRRLTLAGVDRATATTIVSISFLLALFAALLPTLPWLASQAVSGEAALFRYLTGGRVLLDRTLTMLESQFGFLKQMDFHAFVFDALMMSSTVLEVTARFSAPDSFLEISSTLCPP